MIRINRLSNRFSTKIILALLLVILIPTLCTSVYFYWASDLILKKNMRESTIQIVKQTADSLSSMFNSGMDTSDLIYSDESIQRTLSHLNNSSPEEQRRLYQNVKSQLNHIVYTNSYVKSVYILKEEGKGWGSGDFSDYKLSKLLLTDQKWVREAKRMDGEMVWQEIQFDRFSGNNKKTDLVLPVGRVMKDFNTMDNEGFLLVSLNGRSILRSIEQLKLGKTGKFFVVNSDGRIMIDSNLALIGKQVGNSNLRDQIMQEDTTEFEFVSSGMPYYGVKQQLSNGWMIVGTVPIHEITGQLNGLQTQILISSGIFALLAVGIGLLIAGWVTKPVKQLTRDMKLVQQGDLKVRTEVGTSDEIGFLGKQFNKMLHEIEHLMEQVDIEQSQKYQAELRAVIHRVRPHFLYNTLGTLWWLIKSNRIDRAFEGLTALIRLLEANMAKGGSIVTVEEELEVIRKYLIILELRYEKTFHLELDLEPGTEKTLIPRMLLQPLVENAIFHGFVPKKTGGHIWIRVRYCNNGLELFVKDDGLGIDSDKVRTLNEPEKAIAKGEVGIGLLHIYDTLRLHYADQSEWSIRSEPGKGTTIRILINLSLTSDSNKAERSEYDVSSSYRG